MNGSFIGVITLFQSHRRIRTDIKAKVGLARVEPRNYRFKFNIYCWSEMHSAVVAIYANTASLVGTAMLKVDTSSWPLAVEIKLLVGGSRSDSLGPPLSQNKPLSTVSDFHSRDMVQKHELLQAKNAQFAPCWSTWKESSDEIDLPNLEYSRVVVFYARRLLLSIVRLLVTQEYRCSWDIWFRDAKRCRCQPMFCSAAGRLRLWYHGRLCRRKTKTTFTAI